MGKKVGIIFPPAVAGGVLQYALSIAQSLISHVREFDYALIHDPGEPPELFDIPGDSSVEFIERINLNLGPEIRPVRKALHFIGAATNFTPLLIRNLPKAIERAGIDLMIFPTPLTYDLPVGLPFVSTIPDMQHRYMPDAPDYGWRSVKKRDIIYGYYARRSLLNTADSDQSRYDISRFLHVAPDKTRVIPYIAANYIYALRDMPRAEAQTILARFRLPERFVFYPAHYWHQKNHSRLIQAMHSIRQRHGVDIPLVSVGNARGRYARVFESVTATVQRLEMEDLFVHLGYVTNREIVALYRTALALVSPAIEGPTNLPQVEALVLGTPIATVRLFDIPKQVGDAAVLFDPYDVEDIATQIYRLWTDADLRSMLVSRGAERARAFLPEHFAQLWRQTIYDAFRSPG